MYDVICKDCGTKLRDFLKTGMLGCPNCYHAFNDKIEEYALKVHGANTHVGKCPQSDDQDKILLEEYKMLSREREKAVIEQRFDDVNKISLRIFTLAEELKRRGLI